MVIKKFIAKTEEEATLAAKKELGADVIVINVRPVKKGGVFSIFRAPLTEVTVAFEEDGQTQKIVKPNKKTDVNAEAKLSAAYHEEKVKEDIIAQAKTSTMPSMSGLARAAENGKIPPLRVSAQPPAGGMHASKESAETNISAAGQELLKASIQKDDNVMPKAAAPVKEAAGDDSKTKVIEEKLDNLHNLLEQRIVQMPLTTGDAKKPADIENREKKKTEEPQNEEADADAETLSFIKLLYNTLLEHDVDEVYANDLTDEITKVAKAGASLDQALVSVYQKMVLKFGQSEVIQASADGGPKALIFIGPTGVGKTTTIAKLASKLHIQDKKKVALLTVDTYRIAAVEQLRTYATIMETPFRTIYSAEEMKQAIEDFKDYEYIMIDTAGHSLKNEEQKQNIQNFIQVVSEDMESENYLVLSATTKYRDLIEITDTYSALCKYKLVFTKLDETLATGNLYNIHMHTGAPMSYITNGQDVPDDIELFNAQKIVKVLLGGHNK